MGLVALLILVDMLVLTAWYLTDPIRCSRSVAAVVKVKSDHGLRFKAYAKTRLWLKINYYYLDFMTLLVAGDGWTRFLLSVPDGRLLLSVLRLMGNHHRCEEGK